MGGKIDSALAPELSSLITSDHKEILSGVVDPTIYAQTKLNVLLGDPETRVNTTVLPNGDIEVAFTYTLDDNGNPIDGRLFFHDKFTFEANTWRNKGYARNFSYNGSGEEKGKWQQYLAAYQSSALPDQKQAKAFADSVAKGFSRPFTPKMFDALYGKAGAELGNFRPFIATVGGAALEYNLRIHPRNPRSHYAVLNRGTGTNPITEVIFSYTLATKEGLEPLSVQDSFTIDPVTKAMLGYKRVYLTNPGIPSDQKEHWKGVAAKLNGNAAPSDEEAKQFIAAFQKEILDRPFSDLLAETQAVPAAEVKPLSGAEFFSTLAEASVGSQANQMPDIELGLFIGLSLQEAYFKPLNEALGQGFKLNVKNPQLAQETRIEGDRTIVEYRYKLLPGEKASPNYVEYVEKLSFEGMTLKAIERHAKVVGEDKDGSLAAAVSRIETAVHEGKLPAPDSDAGKRFAALTNPYAAPHLARFGKDGKRLKDKPEATADTILIDKTLSDIQGVLLPFLYSSEFDPKVRVSLLQGMAGIAYGDNQLAQNSMLKIGMYFDGLKKQGKLGTEELPKEMIVANLIQSVATGNVQQAYQMAQLLPNAMRDDLMPILEKVMRQGQFGEALQVIGVAFEEQLEKRRVASTAWLSSDKVNADAEKKLLEAVWQKAATQLGKLDATSTLEFLEKIPDLTAEEKAFVARLKSDKVIKRLDLAFRETNPQAQASTYFYVAEQVLMKADLVGSAQLLSHLIVKGHLPKARSTESLEVLSGFATEDIQVQIDKAIKETLEKENKEIETDPAKQQAFTEEAKAILEKNPDYLALVAEGKNFEALWKAALDGLKANPNQDLATLLKGLTLSDPEVAKFRDKLVQDKILLLYASVAGKSPEERMNAYLAPFKQIAAQAGDKAKGDKMLREVAESLKDVNHPTQEAMILLEQLQAFKLDAKQGQIAQSVMDGLLQQRVQQRVSAEHQLKVSAVATLFELAGEKAISQPKRTGFEVLRSLSDKDLDEYLGINKGIARKIKRMGEPTLEQLQALKTEMLKARDTILANKVMEKFSQAAVSDDPMQRKAAYETVLKEGFDVDPKTQQVQLKKDFPYPGTAMLIAQMLDARKLPAIPPVYSEQHYKDVMAFSDKVQDFLALTEGKGSAGLRFEYGANRFFKETTKPTMLAAMTLAGFAGPLSEVAGVKALAAIGRTGRLAEFTAVGIGVIGESIAFTTSHKVLDSTFYAAEGQWGWKRYLKDVTANTVMLGSIKVAHGTLGFLSKNVLAKGRRGFGWAGGYAGAESGANTLIGPLGRVGSAGSMAEGALIPRLTAAGERATMLMEHGGAVAAMYGSGKFNYATGLSDHDGGFADAITMYVQASFGFKLANQLSGGKIHEGLGKLKMGLEYNRARLKPKPEQPKGPVFDLVKPDQGAPEHKAMLDQLATITTGRQMSLAKSFETAKKFEDISKALQYYPDSQCKVLTDTIKQVIEGNKSIEDLPNALGLRRNVSRLMADQVEAWKKAGYVPEGTELQADAQQPHWTALDRAFQTGKAWEAISTVLHGVRDLALLTELVSKSPLEKIGGVSRDTLALQLTVTKLSLDLEQATQAAEMARDAAVEAKNAFDKATSDGASAEKIAELKASHDAAVAKEGEASLALTRMADLIQAMETSFGQVVEAPEEAVEGLPGLGGFRQKARDIHEAAERAHTRAKNRQLTENPAEVELHDLVKKFIHPEMGTHPDLVIETLRSALDRMTPQARMLLFSAPKKSRQAIVDAYLGPKGRRELPSVERAAELGQLLQAAGIDGAHRVVFKFEDGGVVPELQKGNDAELKGDNEVVGIRFRFVNQKGGDVHFTPKEIADAVEQAQEICKSGAKVAEKFPYNAAERTFTAWVWGPIGASRLTVKLDASGEVESIYEHYAVNPKRAPGMTDHIYKPNEIQKMFSDRPWGKKIETTELPFTDLAEQAPFADKSTSLREKLFAKLPGMPRLPMPKRAREFVDKQRAKSRAKADKLGGNADVVFLAELGKKTTDTVVQAVADQFAAAPAGKGLTVVLRINMDTGEVLSGKTRVPHDYTIRVSVDPATGRLELHKADQKVLELRKKGEHNHPRKAVLDALLGITGKKVKPQGGGTPPPDSTPPSDSTPPPFPPPHPSPAGGGGLERGPAPADPAVDAVPTPDVEVPAAVGAKAKAAAPVKAMESGLGALLRGKVEGLREWWRGLEIFAGEPRPITLDDYFAKADPRLAKVETTQKGIMEIKGNRGQKIGEVRIVSGESEGGDHITFPDGTSISIHTSKAVRPSQQDGYVVGWYKLRSGLLVKYAAVVDGAGGGLGGNVAQGGFLLAFQAAIMEFAVARQVPDLAALHRAGHQGVEAQKKLHGFRPGAMFTGTSNIFVAVGDQFETATSGDAMGLHSGKNREGRYEVQGTTETQNQLPLNVIFNGIHANAPVLGRGTLGTGDVYESASDGGLEGILGLAYKIYCGSFFATWRAKAFEAAEFPAGTDPNLHQGFFFNLNRLNDATIANPEGAKVIHDVAVEANDRPGQKSQIAPIEMVLPKDPDVPDDNVTFFRYHQASAPKPFRWSHSMDAKPLTPVPPAPQGFVPRAAVAPTLVDVPAAPEAPVPPAAPAPEPQAAGPLPGFELDPALLGSGPAPAAPAAAKPPVASAKPEAPLPGFSLEDFDLDLGDEPPTLRRTPSPLPPPKSPFPAPKSPLPAPLPPPPHPSPAGGGGLGRGPAPSPLLPPPPGAKAPSPLPPPPLPKSPPPPLPGRQSPPPLPKPPAAPAAGGPPPLPGTPQEAMLVKGRVLTQGLPKLYAVAKEPGKTYQVQLNLADLTGLSRHQNTPVPVRFMVKDGRIQLDPAYVAGVEASMRFAMDPAIQAQLEPLIQAEAQGQMVTDPQVIKQMNVYRFFRDPATRAAIEGILELQDLPIRIQAPEEGVPPTQDDPVLQNVAGQYYFKVGVNDVFKMPKDRNTVEFGRSADADLHYQPHPSLARMDIPHPSVSGRHGVITRMGDQFFVTDLGSTNGTRVYKPGVDKGIVVKGSPVEILPGDKVEMGATAFVFGGESI